MADMEEGIQAIGALLEAFEKAVSDGNAGALEPLFCEQATAFFSGSVKPVRGRSDLVATWERHLERWSSVRIWRRETLVRIHGDVAWAHFLWDGEGVTNGEKYRLDGERWTIVMVWEEGAWRLAQMHTSMPYRDWASHRVGGSV